MPITLSSLAERRAEITFVFSGEEVHVEYLVDKITKEFRAQTLRMAREGRRIQQRGQHLSELIQTVVAADGSEEAQAEDAAAEDAIRQLEEDDLILKRQIDAVLASVVVKWDIVDDDGVMVPLTPDALFPVPALFERAVLECIIEAATQGEANGQRNMKTLPLSLKQRERQENSHQRPIG